MEIIHHHVVNHMIGLQKALVKKTYKVSTGTITSKATVFTNAELGLNRDKVVIPPFVEWYSSIPSSNYFCAEVKWVYRNEIRFYTDYVQDICFTIAWYEYE